MSHQGQGDAIGGSFVGTEGGGIGGGLGSFGEALPFTGAVLTFPIVILGLVLTFWEWLLRRLAGEQPPSAAV